MVIEQTQNKTSDIAVVGLGVSGLSCLRWFRRRGLSVRAFDTRVDPPNGDQVKRDFATTEFFFGPLRVENFDGVRQVVLSPGLPLSDPTIQVLSKRGVEVIGDIELFARHVDAPVIAITGSNGKSTVTTLVGEMALRAGWRTQVGGNLGTPALDLISEPEPELYVLELSSFQLETTNSLRTKAATVLNISADHMDRYNNLKEYADAKQRIFDRADVCVVNLDDPMVVDMVKDKKVSEFTLHKPEDGQYGLLKKHGGTYLAMGDEEIVEVAELKIAGLHNYANALAAIALADAVNIPRDAIVHVLKTFKGLPHRTQFVAEKNGVRWYDDSKGTNVGATIAAVKGMPSQVVLIAGGDGKGQDFSELADAFRDKVRATVLIGRDAQLIEKAIASVTKIVRCTTMADAVEKCALLAEPGDSVLLSPACASFDMFTNYHHRGEVFCKEVKRVLGQ